MESKCSVFRKERRGEVWVRLDERDRNSMGSIENFKLKDYKWDGDSIF